MTSGTAQNDTGFRGGEGGGHPQNQRDKRDNFLFPNAPFLRKSADLPIAITW